MEKFMIWHGLKFHSLLSATIGDNFDAFHAGYIPAITLSDKERSQALIKSIGIKIGGICTAGPPPAGEVVVAILMI